jgi:hypothetical protein
MIESEFRHVEQGAGLACLVVYAYYPDEGVLLIVVVVVVVVVVVRWTVAPAAALDGDGREMQ